MAMDFYEMSHPHMSPATRLVAEWLMDIGPLPSKTEVEKKINDPSLPHKPSWFAVSPSQKGHGNKENNRLWEGRWHRQATCTDGVFCHQSCTLETSQDLSCLEEKEGEREEDKKEGGREVTCWSPDWQGNLETLSDSCLPLLKGRALLWTSWACSLITGKNLGKWLSIWVSSSLTLKALSFWSYTAIGAILVLIQPLLITPPSWPNIQNSSAYLPCLPYPPLNPSSDAPLLFLVLPPLCWSKPLIGIKPAVAHTRQWTPSSLWGSFIVMQYRNPGSLCFSDKLNCSLSEISHSSELFSWNQHDFSKTDHSGSTDGPCQIITGPP